MVSTICLLGGSSLSPAFAAGQIEAGEQKPQADGSGDLKFLSNTPSPFGWGMSYGPVGKVAMKKVVRLKTYQRNGFMMFSCNEDGLSEFAVAIAGFSAKQGTDVKGLVYVGGRSLEVMLKVASEKGTGGVESILYMQGDQVLSLLNALSTQGGGEGLSLMVGEGDALRRMVVPAIAPVGVGVMSANLCVGWHNQQAKKEERKFLSSQMLH